MLTKEKCFRALQFLYDKATYNATGYCGKESLYFSSFDKLWDLINEHFDNPPLKFEELKEEQWYWDNKNKRYFKIHKLDIDNKEIDAYDFWGLGFEENRFYRYEVKE